MKTEVANAVVVLVGAEAGSRVGLAGQTLTIHRPSAPGVIGIDGHTAFWDELVEIHWVGRHLKELERVGQVEIQDAAGVLLENLPVNGYREAYERDGLTVFFLSDAE